LGIPTWKALQDQGYSLQRLFGPEHGFFGIAQDAVPVGDELFQGIKVYSLYGERLGPLQEMIDGQDALMFDLQDIGCRYYTYLYTLANAMQACMNANKEFIVLDRPNPIGGDVVEGGPISEEASSFVGGFGLPHRHGFTIGEYAKYLKDSYFADAKLHIVPMENYRRSMEYSDTSLPWVSPSPNIPAVQTAYIYPGTCLFEGTNLSEGRGTTRPFEIIGAPWIDGEKLRQGLSGLMLPGVLFSGVFFRPTFSKCKDQVCQGVTFHVVDRQVFRPLYTAVAVLRFVREIYPDRFGWKLDWEGEGKYFVDKLAGGPSLRTMIDAGKDPSEIYEKLRQRYDVFMKMRSRCLLYD
jgi:uncharacterized protein YbbC (DUF1343 family)